MIFETRIFVEHTVDTLFLNRLKYCSRFDTSYTQEADISLEEQFDLLTSEVYKMQKNQEETMKDVKEIKSTKQNLLIIDLNGGSANRTYKI